MDLAEHKGMLFDDMLDRMGSRQYTMERARAIVSQAAREIAEAIAKRDQRTRRRR
jgi:hypothetical protein